MTPIANRLTRLGLDTAGAGPKFVLRHDLGDVGAADGDQLLLQQYIQTGSEEAFSQIVYRHSGWVYHTCRRNLHDVHLAEDATQAVFVLLCRKAATIRPETHLGGWLFQACRYVLADIRKSRARYLQRQNLACDLSMQRAASVQRLEAAPDPVLSAAVDEAIAGLRENDRQTILMHFYEGLTLRQMAAKLSITREGAKKRVMRALARLRARLPGKVSTAGKHSILPLMALVLLLRSRAAEAAPADFVAAVAKSATIPGLTSVFVELVVESVRRSFIRGTERLLLRLALAIMILSLLTVASTSLRSLRHGNGATALAVTAAGNDKSANRSGSAQTAAAANASSEDDVNPGLPYERPMELATTPPIVVEAGAAPAEPKKAVASTSARGQVIATASTVVPLPSNSNVAAPVAVVVSPATAGKPLTPQRPADALWLPETAAVVDATPASAPIPMVPTRPHPSQPSPSEDHQTSQPGESPHRPVPPGPGGPPPMVDENSFGHAPDRPVIVLIRTQHAESAVENQFAARAPVPPADLPPDHGNAMPGRSGKDGGWGIPPVTTGAPHQVAREDGTMHPVMIRPPLPDKSPNNTFSPPDGMPEFGFAVLGKNPPDFRASNGVDPESLMFAMDNRPFAAWPDMAAGSDQFEPFRVGRSPIGAGYDSGYDSAFAAETRMPGLSPAAADPSPAAMDAVVVPEPTGGCLLIFALSALTARRRR